MSMDFLEAVEEQLVTATERGISRRRWRWPWLMRVRLPWRAPTIGIAAGVGATLAASAIAATLTLPASHPQTKVSTTTPAHVVRSYTTAGAAPVAFQPASFTAITEFTWWLLGTAPCSGGHACTTVVQTTDGGRTFTRVPAPPTTAVSNLRFADATNGYAYGQQLWSTHDNGVSWTQVPLGGEVTDLEIADGYAYALVSGNGHSSLMRSTVSADNWTALTGLGHGALSGLWIQGPTVIIQSGDRLYVSSDNGNHFARKRGVVGAGDCSFDGGPQALWALCSRGMAPDEILLSSDSGSTFRAAAQVPNGPLGTFAAASGTVAVVSAQGPLYRTTDSGSSWIRVAGLPPANWTYLGFSDPTHGVAIGSFGTGGHQYSKLYYTIDGGASYHAVPIGP
jgi:photosystem II stability/assembly factor-like uncharacterized protein